MTARHDLEPIVHDWLHSTLDAIPDPTHRYGLVASEVNETPQQHTWLPVPLPAQFTMWSTTKSIVAISIVALFGAILLTGMLSGRQLDEATPATVSEKSAFPTGTFESEDGELRLEFRPDGACVRAGVRCTFGVNGSLFSEMAFEDPAGRKVPATYYWHFDGERLTFEPWGADLQSVRGDTYAGHTYRPVGETKPLLAAETGFPTGRFVAVDDSETGLIFREGGGWQATNPSGGASGRYAVTGNLYTEMRHNVPSTAKVPATYEWQWDGKQLQFIPWGDDADAWRRSFYVDHVYARAPEPAGPMRRLLLSDPRLDVWVTVEISRRDEGGFAATATIEEEPLGEGVGDTLQEAVKAALQPLGEPYASDIAEKLTG